MLFPDLYLVTLKHTSPVCVLVRKEIYNVLEIKETSEPKKFDITLKRSEWEKLRPTIKELQAKAQVDYTVQDFNDCVTGEPTVLIICEATKEADAKIDAKLKEILGYVYA